MRLLFSILALLVAPPAPQALVVTDIDGARVTPLAPAAGDVHLLFFITTDCPISNRYAPEIDRIAAAYAGRRVRTFLVYADPTLTSARVRAHAHDFHPTRRATAVIDTGFVLANAVGATVTPEAAVFSAAGRVYRGRIDDWYVALGRSRAAPTSQDLRRALDATLAGAPVTPAETPAIGCYIERRNHP